MKILFTTCLVAVSLLTFGQTVTLNPTITPAIFEYNTSITVTYDVTGTPLANLTAAYLWIWDPGNLVLTPPSNLTPASSHATATAIAAFEKTIGGGKTLWSITFVPSAIFAGSDISAVTQLGMLLKGDDWSNGQTSDFLAAVSNGSFEVKLITPTQSNVFANNGDVISIEAQTTVSASYTLSVNNVVVDTKNALTDYTYQLTVSDATPSSNIVISASANGTTSTASFTYVIIKPSPSAPRPVGIIDGINYSSDLTKVTLSLWAPKKTTVYLMGDFNNWQVDPNYEMNRDGEHFWLEVGGLTTNTEYGYQYFVDDSVFIADPYADKILDAANDPSIPATTYPNLKPYPAGAKHTQDYFNRVAVFQTGQTPYAWTATNYQKPVKEKLVIYELLIRDFFDQANRNYQSLIDTIGYFKHLGVNAIELMPITEFSGNDSWGYNPTFMFAPDKYYGTKNKLKEFVDTCHKNGIAVIMDMVLNQQDMSNPYVLMYYDFVKNQPTPQSPWFNVTATHPYSVFYDLNHESKYTQAYVDTINYHWANEYHIDGYRYDLAKGFTQFNSGSDVNLWGQYDQSRVNIIERMADVLWAHNPDEYIILEFFGVNQEETVYANYRASEGKGMMLWENYNSQFNQISMGFATSSDVSAEYFVNKQWMMPHEVSYMESHDEERLMYKNENFGNGAGSYNVKTLSTALDRMKGTSLLFYTVPGPKMLWEFGELGYDISIGLCADGTINGCNTADKPVGWTLRTNENRQKLLAHTADLIRLATHFSVFSQGDVTMTTGDALVRSTVLKNKPYTDTPADSTQMNVAVVANMDVTGQSATFTFPHTGNWYEYYTATTANISAAAVSTTLAPGEYRLYTDVKITKPKVSVVTGLEEKVQPFVQIYPNPSTETIQAKADSPITTLSITTMQGIKIQPARTADNTWDVHELASGVYIAEVLMNGRITRVKIIKK